MIKVETVDLSGLDQFIGAFARATQITSRDAVTYQTGRLMADMANGFPPKTVAKADKKAAWQVRKSFYAVKRGSGAYDLDGQKPLFEGRQAKGTGIVWLYSSKTVLVGTPKQYDKTGVSRSQMMSMHKVQRNRVDKRWTQIGMRKKQRVMWVSKPVVQASEAKAFIGTVRDEFGKLKASVLKGRNNVGLKIELPNFVKKHLQDSKGGFIPVRPNEVSPSTTIISYSPGCEHPRVIKLIKGYLRKRSEAIKKDLVLYYSGIKNASDFRGNQGFKQYKPADLVETAFSA